MAYNTTMPKATLYHHEKLVFPDGAIAESKIWKLPQPTAERPHGLKYSLVYIVAGQRVIGYDNERGKGDHRHDGDQEAPYTFVSVEQLMVDFLQDVAIARGEL